MLLSAYELFLFSFHPTKIDVTLSWIGFLKFSHTVNDDVNRITGHEVKRQEPYVHEEGC